MNSNIYYQFELFSREEYYNKNKKILDKIFKDEFVNKAHLLLVNKWNFFAVSSLMTIYYLKDVSKYNFALNRLSKNSVKLFLFVFLNVNIFLRSFDKEFPIDGESEVKQDKIILFSKSLVNHNFCLIKDLYLILVLYNLKLIFAPKSTINIKITNESSKLNFNKNSELALELDKDIEDIREISLSEKNRLLNNKI